MKSSVKKAPPSERQIKAKKLAPKTKAPKKPAADSGWRVRGPERFAEGYPVSSLEHVRRAYRPEMTQADVAEGMGITQSLVSRLERRESLDGVSIETIRRYVESLGAKLELVATFPTGHRTGLGGAR